MAAAAISTPSAQAVPPSEPGEARLVVHGVSWKDYTIAREALDGPGLRMAFCEGVLELMSPLRPHEEWKKNVARLVELWALERDVPLYGYGSTIWSHDGTSYQRVDRSTVLPDLDFVQLARFVVRSDQPQALKEWREVIRVR